jgi:purine-binding chemotaxis protein CheW
MSESSTTVLELRRAFDAAFAIEPAAAPDEILLMAVRAGARSCAVRVSDLAGVVRFSGAAPFPTGEPAFLGIAVVRGATVPVYDLAAILGEGVDRVPRWLLLAAGTDHVALAFDELEGYLRVRTEDLVTAAAADGGASEPRSQVVRDGGGMRPLVSVPAVLQRLKARLGNEAKER